MTVSSAPSAEQTRTRSGARRGNGQRVLIASSATATRIEPLRPSAKLLSGRAVAQAARRLERRQRRVVAAMGLFVLAGMLVLTVVVLDVLH